MDTMWLPVQRLRSIRVTACLRHVAAPSKALDWQPPQRRQRGVHIGNVSVSGSRDTALELAVSVTVSWMSTRVPRRCRR
jgi:hypothetical protein